MYDSEDAYHYILVSLAPAVLADISPSDVGDLDHPATTFARDARGRFTGAEALQAAGPQPPAGPLYSAAEALNLALHVTESGKANHAGLRIRVNSHLNIPALQFLLADCPDQWPLRGATYGWPLGRDPAIHLSGQTHRNHNSAIRDMAQVKEYLQAEIDHGALFVLGPAPPRLNPWGVSTIPLLTVPKPPHPTKVRVCGDMSFPAGASVNDAIPLDTYGGVPYRVRLPNIWDFLATVVEVGIEDALVAKADLSRGYRQLPVCPGDWTSQLFYVPDTGYLMDTRAIFGGRPCGLFMQRTNQALTRAAALATTPVHEELARASVNPDRAAWRAISPYIDDALVVAHRACAAGVWDNLLAVYEAANIKLSTTAGHVSNPSRQVRALGFHVDCDTGFVSIPPGKLNEMLVLVANLIEAGVATPLQVKQLLGRVCRCIMVIKEGRPFISRLIELIEGQPARPLEPRRLHPGQLADLHWWARHGPKLNERALIAPPTGPLTSTILVDGRGRQADGGLPSLGGLCYPIRQFFAMVAPAEFAQSPVHVIEAIALLAAARAWVPTLPEYSVVAIGSDNQPVVNAFHHGRASDPALAAMTRLLWGVFATSTCTAELRYVPTKDNSADGVSRLNTKDITCLSETGWTRLSLPPAYFALDESDVFHYQEAAPTPWRPPPS